ncbi:hypothetical protein [Mangrovibacillus cuniculi]|uniref:Uncharacterized protein n=1 Tax=Mangrovibacillus cuniculi TaxID=2593652 RepID=A0A7S8CB06_9BACI|nr:hypothetical protein [Mangrovibacillus cuniculi]QPC46541.1 hypothetical protein G8O30_05955 [Mangrovibacillus cuniculi]
MDTIISLYEKAGYLGIFLFGFIGLIGLPLPNEVIVMTSGWMSRMSVVQPIPALVMTIMSLLAVVSTCFGVGRGISQAATKCLLNSGGKERKRHLKSTKIKH